MVTGSAGCVADDEDAVDRVVLVVSSHMFLGGVVQRGFTLSCRVLSGHLEAYAKLLFDSRSSGGVPNGQRPVLLI